MITLAPLNFSLKPASVKRAANYNTPRFSQGDTPPAVTGSTAPSTPVVAKPTVPVVSVTPPTQTAPKPEAITFSSDASILLQTMPSLVQMGNNPAENFHVTLLQLLLTQASVTDYLRQQGFSPFDIFKGIKKVYDAGLQTLGSSRLTNAQVGDMAKQLQAFAIEQKLETVTPVTILRWVLTTDPTKSLEKHLEFAGLKPDMVTRLKAVPNTEIKALDKPYRPSREEVIALETALEKLPPMMIGQEEPTRKLLLAYETAKLGYQHDKDSPNRPLVQMIVGPSGCGKTFTVEKLADVVGRELIYVPLNQYLDDASVYRFTGAMPGHIGYGDGTSVAERLIRAREEHVTKGKPLPIVLFDEIEKAHPKVFDALMQLLDKGIMESGNGQVAKMKGIDVFITSNIGQKEIADAYKLGQKPKELEALVKQQMQRHFRPEFIGRVGDPVIFNMLTLENAGKIMDKRLEGFKKTVAEADNIALTIDASLRDEILAQGYQEELGMRPLKRAVENLLHSPLVENRKALIKAGHFDGADPPPPLSLSTRYDKTQGKTLVENIPTAAA